jgi:hypothetical protein
MSLERSIQSVLLGIPYVVVQLLYSAATCLARAAYSTTLLYQAKA